MWGSAGFVRIYGHMTHRRPTDTAVVIGCLYRDRREGYRHGGRQAVRKRQQCPPRTVDRAGHPRPRHALPDCPTLFGTLGPNFRTQGSPLGPGGLSEGAAPGQHLRRPELDRLGRDLKHRVTTVDELSARGVGLRVLAGAGAEIDTTTANGRLVFGIFAALAEFERELIAERTRAGLAAAGRARWTWPCCAWRYVPWRHATPTPRTSRAVSASPRRPFTCTSTATVR